MLKQILTLAQCVDSVALTFSAKPGDKPRLVLMPNHAALKEYPVLGRGLVVEADSVEEIEERLATALSGFSEVYVPLSQQLMELQAEAKASLTAARAKTGRTVTAVGGKPSVPPKKEIKPTSPPPPPPTWPSLFGDEPPPATAHKAMPPEPEFDADDASLDSEEQ